MYGCMYPCMYVCMLVSVQILSMYVCMYMVLPIALYGKQGRGAQYNSKAERDKFLQVTLCVCMYITYTISILIHTYIHTYIHTGSNQHPYKKGRRQEEGDREVAT